MKVPVGTFARLVVRPHPCLVRTAVQRAPGLAAVRRPPEDAERQLNYVVGRAATAGRRVLAAPQLARVGGGAVGGSRADRVRLVDRHAHVRAATTLERRAELISEAGRRDDAQQKGGPIRSLLQAVVV